MKPPGESNRKSYAPSEVRRKYLECYKDRGHLSDQRRLSGREALCLALNTMKIRKGKESPRQSRCRGVGVRGIPGNQRLSVLIKMGLVRTWGFQGPKEGRGKSTQTKNHTDGSKGSLGS